MKDEKIRESNCRYRIPVSRAAPLSSWLLQSLLLLLLLLLYLFPSPAVVVIEPIEVARLCACRFSLAQIKNTQVLLLPSNQPTRDDGTKTDESEPHHQYDVDSMAGMIANADVKNGVFPVRPIEKQRVPWI